MVTQVIQHVCPGCKHINTPKGRALTVALSCEECKLYFTVHTDAQSKFTESYDPILPIGSVANIKDGFYRVMGFSVKRERKWRYSWHEYFLFSPDAGIAFLTTYDGHWNFLKPNVKHPWLFGGANFDPEFDEKTFNIYAKYKADLLFASGEFFCDIIEATESSVHYEHIHPPYIITFEDNDQHLSAYRGEYMPRQSVASAFNIPIKKLPKKSGVGYTQPINLRFDEDTMLRISGIATLFLIMLQLIFFGSASSQKILDKSFKQADLQTDKMFKTPSFELKDGTKNLQVDIYAPIQNDWFFGEFVLINEGSNDEYTFTKEIEFYSGYDAGYLWTEGSTRGEAFLSSIPEGMYHINIYPEFSPSNHDFSIAITRDVPFSSNFWIMLLGLWVFPIAYFIYKQRIEVIRWRDSEFSPYEE
jgi:hypothetical protein